MGMMYHVDQNFLAAPLHLGELSLFQIGRAYCKCDTVVAEHLHADFWELTVVTDGSGTAITEKVPTRLEKGDIYLSFPHEIHRIEADTANPLKYDFFAFQTENQQLRNALEELARQHRSPTSRIFHSEHIRPLIEGAIAELYENQVFSSELLELILKQVPIHVLRAFSATAPKAPYPSDTHAKILSYQIMHYIDTHIRTLNNLRELSEALGYSYKYLSAFFKQQTDQTLSDYLSERRLELAKRLLTENGGRVGEVAERLNYSSIYAFSRAFRARFGLSPREYYRTAQSSLAEHSDARKAP